MKEKNVSLFNGHSDFTYQWGIRNMTFMPLSSHCYLNTMNSSQLPLAVIDEIMRENNVELLQSKTLTVCSRCFTLVYISLIEFIINDTPDIIILLYSNIHLDFQFSMRFDGNLTKSVSLMHVIIPQSVYTMQKSWIWY